MYAHLQFQRKNLLSDGYGVQILIALFGSPTELMLVLAPTQIHGGPKAHDQDPKKHQ